MTTITDLDWHRNADGTVVRFVKTVWSTKRGKRHDIVEQDILAELTGHEFEAVVVDAVRLLPHVRL